MTEKKTQKKRVVSMWQYAGYLAKKFGLKSTGKTLVALSVLCTIPAVILSIWLMSCLIGSFWYKPERDYTGSNFLLATIDGMLFYVAWFANRIGSQALKASSKIEDVMPLTRHNANWIPSEESLVRGSQQPAQQPETLLRAAQADETPTDQLLRPG